MGLHKRRKRKKEQLVIVRGFYLYKILYSFGERPIEKTGCVEISWDNAFPHQSIDEKRTENQ
jgi:hypothetical protein